MLQADIIQFFMQSAMQNKHNEMEIRSKLWIEVNGEPVFGKGRRILLEAIRRYGSINQAAKEINISYRKAWSYIKVMEERLGMKLIERQVGGRNGGGATLTADAQWFLRQYEELEKDIEGLVDTKFRTVFKNNGRRGHHV